MTELYRGLLLVITNKIYDLILSFRTHIQSFNQNTNDNDSYFDFGILGFWNLMLEITFTIYALMCLIFGVILVASLSIVFYPSYAILRYASFVLKNTRNPQQAEIPVLKEEIASADNSPVIIKKEK